VDNTRIIFGKAVQVGGGLLLFRVLIILDDYDDAEGQIRWPRGRGTG